MTVALVGNPNTGKSTLFNALTGNRQLVGNYPGVTVEKRVGTVRADDHGPRVEVVDLPGAYSLAARGQDEAIVLDVLMGRMGETAYPDVIVVVVDASNLSRNLFFTTQVLEIGRPVVVALNMVDVAEASGVKVDAEALGRELGAPVIAVVATKRIGIESLRRAILDSLGAPATQRSVEFPDCVRAELDELTASVARSTECSDGAASRVEALQTLLAPGGYHERRLLSRCDAGLASELAQRRQRIVAAGESIVEVEAKVRYAWINGVIKRVTARVRPGRRSRTVALDRVLTHGVLGIAILLFVMGMCFQAIYTWAAPIMGAIDAALGALGVAFAQAIPEGALQSMMVDGVIAGVGAVLVFLPQILILFFFIAVLEDCGYMSRAAFLLDRWMGYVGLNGKSFIPLLSSFACAVPGIMATRTIDDRRDRFLTILIAPLMSCSARLPIYILLIGAFVPATPLMGGLVGAQALTLLTMYFVGIFLAILVALVLKRSVLKGEPQPFLMELPTFKWPSPRIVLYRVYEQGKQFLISAGTIIFAVTIVVWALGYYPHPASITADHEARRFAARREHAQRLDRIAREYDKALTAETLLTQGPVASVLAAIERRLADSGDAGGSDDGAGRQPAQQREVDDRIAAIVAEAGAAGEVALTVHQANRALGERLADLRRRESGTYLRESLLGRMGRWIEPLVQPLGWDWRIGTAVIASLPAREVVVATMGTIYNLGGEEDEISAGLRQKLQQATWPDGRPVFNLAVALSVMVFFALCCQCAATIATIRRETYSWRWPLFTFAYMTTLAYLGAFATYQIAIRLI